GGVHQNRSLPKVSNRNFSKVLQSLKNEYSTIDNNNKKLIIFIDEFSNYLDAEIAMDAFLLLIGLGYKVTVIDTLDSGRALISKGSKKEAKIEANKNIA